MSRKLKSLELNKDYTPSKIITSERAFVLTVKNHATALFFHDGKFFHSPSREYPCPSVILIHKGWKNSYHRVPFTKQNVFKRDNYTCQYCNVKYNYLSLTIDHVIPTSKGGKNIWNNVVSSCLSCNNQKGNKDFDELPDDFIKNGKKIKPFRPHHLYLMHRLEYIPEEWKPFLFL